MKEQGRRMLSGAPLLAVGLWLTASPLVAQDSDVQGAWRVETYVMAAGAEHPAEGRIFFTESDWQVLFFTLDEEGVVKRASAEGGTYTLEGDALTFRHLHNLSVGDAIEGREATPLRRIYWSPEEGPVEPTHAYVDGDRMTLAFPGGNRLLLTRSSR
ncbi:MAG: hypothetical protein QF664_08670 [Dehalococcoidia bacterium]|jgi:hypothetical protein|nr:hypothetical protein [Dehalococcoidia bacterium]